MPYFLLYVFILILLTAILLFYYWMAGLEWSEKERRRMLDEQLALSTIWSVVAGADGRHLMARTRSSRALFYRYSRSMKSEVVDLLRLSRAGFRTVALALIFFVAYLALRAKSLLFCSTRDLQFLVGLELSIFRSFKD